MGTTGVVVRRGVGAVVAAAALAFGVSGLPSEAARLDEKTVNLDVALRAANALRGRGVDVAMTRERDVFVPLGERTALARQVGAEALISVHHNAGAPARKGTELYRQVGRDRRLADSVSTAWRERMPDRPILVLARPNERGGDYYFVLRTSPVPALLVEGGYLSNAADARRLADPAYRQAEADAIATGVLRWLGVTTAPAAPDLPAGSRQTVDALPAPSGAAAVARGRSAVDLRWSTSPLVEAYRVYREGRLIGIVDNTGRASAAPTTVQFADTWASAGTTYRYELRAVALKGGLALESRATTVTATVPRAKVVVDAGHGGRDPGTGAEV